MTTVNERTTTTIAHPLEPLSADEIGSAADIIKGSDKWSDGCRFVYIELQEPPKEAVLAWEKGTEWDRQAAALIRDRTNRATVEAVASLTTGEVVSWKVIDAVQAPMMFEEFMECEEVVRKDERWQDAMRKRGVEDFQMCMIDPWACGYTGDSDDPTKHRLAKPLTFVRRSEHDNGYARPVEGLVVTVDLDEMKVVDVTDYGVVPLPPKSGNWYPELKFEEDNIIGLKEDRAPLKPLEITQPDGPSFSVDGHKVVWSNWELRLGFNPREGLVIYDVNYRDKGELRPVIYRASLSEMYVPYGDPSPVHSNKNVFDEGEYGLGWMANSLELGCDCLGEIKYFDGFVNDQDGNPVVIKNAICMHEEDYSIGWKHTDFRTERVGIGRNRRLVVSSICTVGNYEYAFYWNFYLDGSIEFEIKLTGILSLGAFDPDGELPAWGTVVAPGLYAPNHEHFFSVRLDMRVDGDRNNLYEVNSVSDPEGPENPYNNAWRAVKTHLASESQAQREPDTLAGRTWLVTSADKTNQLGQPTGYKFESGHYSSPLWREGSQHAARGGFATKQLWGTAYDPEEKFAAGRYVPQNAGPDGLVAYTAGNRSLVDSDLVVWYTLNAHHVVRPEDWPVMPVSHVRMHMKPFGFFAGNPMLDIPDAKSCHAVPDAGSASTGHSACACGEHCNCGSSCSCGADCGCSS